MFGLDSAATRVLMSRIARLEGAVRRQQATIEELCRHLDIVPPAIDPAQTLDAEEVRLIGAGKKIAAIKHHRERTGSGLREAKNAIEHG